MQIDDGPWEDAADLAAEALDTAAVQARGRMTPGAHSATVRAYDAQGQLQTSEKANPVPNEMPAAGNAPIHCAVGADCSLLATQHLDDFQLRVRVSSP